MVLRTNGHGIGPGLFVDALVVGKIAERVNLSVGTIEVPHHAGDGAGVQAARQRGRYRNVAVHVQHDILLKQLTYMPHGFVERDVNRIGRHFPERRLSAEERSSSESSIQEPAHNWWTPATIDSSECSISPWIR